MKLVAILLLAFIAAAYSAPAGFDGPVSISDNNVGDIVSIGVNANAAITSKIDQNIVNVIVALLNQQAIAVGGGDSQDAAAV